MKITVKGYGPVAIDDSSYPAHLHDENHHHFNVWGTPGEGYRPRGDHEYEVDPKHLFDNQVNTICGHRIHDWADYMSRNRRQRWGHYIVNLEELNEYRRQFFKCGFCGHMDQEGGWCPKCRGSEYLKVEDYPLLWMNPLASEKIRPVPAQEIVKSIQQAQAETFERKSLEFFARKQEDLNQAKKDVALQERFFNHCCATGLTWKQMKNCIFYNHKQTFCFGWSTPLSETEVEKIQTSLGEHDFWVEFKT